MAFTSKSVFYYRVLKAQSRVDLVGLDIGTKSTGVALASDIKQKYEIRPYDTILTSNLANISEILQSSDGVVVGIPRNSPGLKTMIEEQVSLLQRLTMKPFLKQDEHFSTVEATSLIGEVSPRLKHNKELKDQVAACKILERFIASLIY